MELKPWVTRAPIVIDGHVVGAVGVSGNTGEREGELAKEAAARAPSSASG